MNLRNIYEEVTALRHNLHKCPELSFHEEQTKALLIRFLNENTKLEIVDRGSWFYAYRAADSKQENQTKQMTITASPDDSNHQTSLSAQSPLAFRADFDAVAGPDGKAYHRCGHDGHSAVLAGLAMILSEEDFHSDRDIYLIFQPAEEIGEGAAHCAVLIDEKNIGSIYGFHNIPGYPAGEILLLPGTFACASTGLAITMTGAPAHAAYPESGRNPALALAELVRYVNHRIVQPSQGMILGTVIGLELGGNAYGMSASEGVLRLTLRGEYEREFLALLEDVKQEARKLAEEHRLEVTFTHVEPFPATENTPACVSKVEAAATANHLPHRYLPEPMRWSEDFGCYLHHTKGAMFGIGSGEDHADLHTKDYEFPDEIIPAALCIFQAIADTE